MKITFEQDKYYITCGYGDRQAIKAAGFKWESSTKRWFTNNFYIAYDGSKKLGVNDFPDELYQKILNIRNSHSNLPMSDAWEGPLFDYQKAGVEQLEENGNKLLADEQGLGKTLQVIEYLNRSLHKKRLIICPASLKLNWAREFQLWGTGLFSTRVITHGKDNFAIEESLITGESHDTIIVNYDLLKSKIIMDQLLAFKPDVLVCDEAHYLKSAKTVRTKNVAKLARVVAKKIFLTGTPMLNRPVELFAILKMLSPETLKPYDNYRNYAYRFCSAYNSRWGLDVSGNSNVEELGVRLRATCMIRRLKKDVMKQLPEKTVQLIPFEMDKKAEKIIEKGEWFSIEDLKKYPERGSMGELATIRRELAMLKLDESTSYITDLLEGIDKVVVFAYHHDVINGLKEKLEQFNPVVLTGKHSAVNKQKAVDDFQDKKDTRVFIGQIQAAGTGLTLTAASTVVFVESSWVPGEINQAIDRCHRIGQQSNVTAKFLVVEKSLDETMLKTIFDKEKIINQIMQ